MIDAPKLYALLQKATTVNEEVFDVRFEEVVSLVDQEQLDEASTLIHTILKEGKVDLRLVMYLFYAQFINQGIRSLSEIFPAMQTVLTDHWAKISPVNMRDKYLQSSLAWFLSSIGKKIKRSEKLYKSKKTDDFWNKSISGLTPQIIEALIACTRDFTAFLPSKVDDPSIHQYILFISKWLENLRGLAEEDTIEPAAEAPVPVTSQAQPVNALPSPKLPLHEVLASSELMLRLYRKIEAFEALIEKQDFEKAALIADDIDQTIKTFDPSTFFPKLFSNYFALSASHIDTLSQEWANKTSLKWEALHRLYQTDIEEFIQW